MPGLDLLAENDLEGGWVVGCYVGADGGVEGVEDFGGELGRLLEGTYVVRRIGICYLLGRRSLGLYGDISVSTF